MVFDGARLGEYRKKNTDLTQEKLAELADVSLSVLKSLETNRRRAKDEDVEKLCGILNVDKNLFMKRDTKVISVILHKGGSGKTSTAANLGYSFAKHLNKKVLLVDSDMQRNLTLHFGMDVDDEKNFYKAVIERKSILPHIRQTAYENIDMVTSADAVSFLENEINPMDLREFVVRDILKEVRELGIYDYVIFDCSPFIATTNRAILYASDEILIPMVASPFGTSGLVYFRKYIDPILRYCDNLNLLGVVFCNYDTRKKITHSVEEEIKEYFGDIILNTKIPVDTVIEQAQDVSMPVGAFFDGARSNIAYNELAEEIDSIISRR